MIVMEWNWWRELLAVGLGLGIEKDQKNQGFRNLGESLIEPFISQLKKKGAVFDDLGLAMEKGDRGRMGQEELESNLVRVLERNWGKREIEFCMVKLRQEIGGIGC